MNNRSSIPNIPSTGSVISVKWEPREETYHPVTSRELRHVRNKNLWVDLFIMFFSLFVGATLSTIVTKSVIADLSDTANATLTAYQWIFLVVGIIFLIFAIWFYVDRDHDIGEMVKTAQKARSS